MFQSAINDLGSPRADGSRNTKAAAEDLQGQKPADYDSMGGRGIKLAVMK
jgi:hypothetical protein